MKQLFKNILPLALAALLFSCTEADRSEANEANQDQAYANYENFVTGLEEDSLAEIEKRAMRQDTSLSWEQQQENMQQRFQQLKADVSKNSSAYSDSQRQEVGNLESRYNTAMANRQQQYEEVSRRYALRKELLGLDISSDDFSEITAANIAPTYAHFVQELQTRAGDLQPRDWEMVQGWWVTLNNRKRTLEGELPAAANKTIAAATDKFRSLMEQYGA